MARSRAGWRLLIAGGMYGARRVLAKGRFGSSSAGLGGRFSLGDVLELVDDYVALREVGDDPEFSAHGRHGRLPRLRVL